jgi:hypothetical protein
MAEWVIIRLDRMIHYQGTNGQKILGYWNDIFQKLISGFADAGLPGQAGQ